MNEAIKYPNATRLPSFNQQISLEEIPMANESSKYFPNPTHLPSLNPMDSSKRIPPWT